MKKTLLVTIDFPPSVGGVAAYYNNICKNLLPEKLVVLAPKERGSEKFDRDQKYKIIRENLISKNPMIWPKWWPMIKIVKKIIEKEKIKVILAGQILPVGTVAFYLNRTQKIPYYIFCHGMDIYQLKGRKKTLATKIFKNSAGAFANSNFTKNKEIELGAKNIEIIYPCPNVTKAPDEKSIERIKIKHDLYDKKILLSVGRLTKRKGHGQVILSLSKVLEKFSNAIYVIAGDGEERENLEFLARNKRVVNNVVFTGKISDENLGALYEICDIFIMPSRQLLNGDVEGFGIVYLEANSFSKPVIAGDSGGANEAVIDNLNGLLVDPERPEKISEAIIKLFADKSLAIKLGVQGEVRVLEEFRWEKQAEKVEKKLSLIFK